MTQLEQPQNPPQRRQAARNIPNPQDARVEEQMPDLPYQPARRRDPNNRGRIREDEPFRQGTSDIELTLPAFVGKVNPDAYLDWERHMEYIFECYGYNKRKKIAFDAAQLTEFALSWWDREVSERRRNNFGQLETWADMKFYQRRRYVPPLHYHRDIQRRFCKLSQGSKSVEEYYDEFEQLRNRLELDDSEEALMAQFVDGLQERIARKVERQHYYQIHKLLHLAIQVEQQIKRKTAPHNNHKSYDKGKTVEIESKLKRPLLTPTKDHGKSKVSLLTLLKPVTLFVLSVKAGDTWQGNVLIKE